MSASSFIGGFSRRRGADVAPALPSQTPQDDPSLATGGARPDLAAAVAAEHDDTDMTGWRGEIGAQLRERVVVEHVTRPARSLRVFTARVEGSTDLLEWSTQRRTDISVGDRLALSGLVKEHVTRGETRVTVLRDCFNPMRMS